MGKRCLKCLLQENASLTNELCRKIGCTIKVAMELEWPYQSSKVEPIPGPKGPATHRIPFGVLPSIADSPAGRTQSRSVIAEEIEEEEEGGGKTIAMRHNPL